MAEDEQETLEDAGSVEEGINGNGEAEHLEAGGINIKDIDYILILTVHPGFYGAKYLRGPLRKIKQIKKMNSKIKIIVDGGMKPSTIRDARGADFFVSGSFISKAENPKKAVRELEKRIR